MNGHGILAHTLKNLGVTHIYSISGGPIRETLPVCSQVGIRIIGVRHQQAGVFMAAAHNYVAGRLTAVAILSAGPAVTNATTSILFAKDNCWPLLVLGGKNTNPGATHSGVFQALDGAGLFQSISKWSAEIESTSQIAEYVTRGCHLAISDQPGPVYLDVPVGVLTGEASLIDAPQYQQPIIRELDSRSIQNAAKLLLQAQRPAVIIGKGIRWSEPYQELRTLIEKYRIPFITSPMGRGFLPDDHPWCFNAARDVLQQQADTIVLLGARLDWAFRFGTEFAKDVKLIHVDIAQKELAIHLPLSIGITGDVKLVLQELLHQLEIQHNKAIPSYGREEWHRLLQETQKTSIQRREDMAHDSIIPMSPHRLMGEIKKFLPRDAICIMEGRDSMAAAQEVVPCYEPTSRFTAGSNGCMGVGIPFGLGAKLSSPDRMVVVISGDMAFGISAMEMETAVRHKIPVIVIVVNSDGINGGSTHKLYPPGHERVTLFQPRISYEKIMEAFGGFAEAIDRPEEVQPALRRAAESGVPACLNVYVNSNLPFKNYLG